jgi:hypothetical protein
MLPDWWIAVIADIASSEKKKVLTPEDAKEHGGQSA